MIRAHVICAEVADHFRISPRRLSLSHVTPIWSTADDARGVAVFLIRRRTPLRRDQVAKVFDCPSQHVGRLDHIEHETMRRIESDPLLREATEAVRSRLDQIDRAAWVSPLGIAA